MILKTALVQTDIEWGCKARNIAEADRIAAAADADLVIFPEMFATGFMSVDNCGQAETMDGMTVSWMRNCALKGGKAIAGSVIIQDGRDVFNRFVFAFPDGNLSWYDKRHLFSFSGEDKLYSAGCKRVVIEYKGVRILPVVCYDLRFPVWSRNRQDYDVAVYVASWPQSRIAAWDILLRARAIENQCYILGVNRTGSDPSATYNGHSAAVDYLGRVTADLPDGKNGVIYSCLDMDELGAYRDKFRAWADADNFNVIL